MIDLFAKNMRWLIELDWTRFAIFGLLFERGCDEQKWW
jgi:hypothetical protein